MISLYIHWPFCLSKCPYCDFNSYRAEEVDQERWRRAFLRELAHYAALLPERRVRTVYFGGGTPSLMEARTVEAVLADIARLWPIEADAEVTLEANPSSAEAGKFLEFARAGVNRLSLGVQSLNDETLKFLGRAHDAAEARKALALASKCFPRFSFDLIYAAQGQTLEDWRRELGEALTLAEGHVSLYQLTIEPKTVFGAQARRGEIILAEEETGAALFEATQEMTAAAGLPAYEISNHARAGQESRHNLAYWHYEDYVGIGPGAHGRFRLSRQRHATENLRKPEAWLSQVEDLGNGIAENMVLSETESMREAALMGLRLAEGIHLENWDKKFPVPLTQFLPLPRIERLEKEGLMLLDEKHLRATSAGLQRLNAVLAYLMPNDQ